MLFDWLVIGHHCRGSGAGRHLIPSRNTSETKEFMTHGNACEGPHRLCHLRICAES
jgi:hypothetical protein